MNEQKPEIGKIVNVCGKELFCVDPAIHGELVEGTNGPVELNNLFKNKWWCKEVGSTEFVLCCFE